ncbi:hypothetical protein HOD20_02825 [archaeon]|jgi:uncharacterized protein (UPF0333 family)|nr:hypothetical protein [archaeon]MBT4351439.1 hypothetical protein [archaeon]MBT4647270.1 hypothetical protein [archaeon]MBT6821167.1 hypothetical protein [archaeon]MBT7391665.1 hypothetical protein [archaeon]
MKKRGQISVEFIVIYGFVLLMMIPLTIIFYTQSGDTKDVLYNNQLHNIGTRVIDKAESIYYYGQPSKTTIKAYFPENIENITIKNREFIFKFRNSKNTLNEIILTSLVNISGSVSNNQGIHYIIIESQGDYVKISG